MKLCLVTVGATAPFEKLIRQVLSEPFLASLKQHNYTHLLVQYGKDGKPIMDEFLEKNPEECESLHGIGIGGFDFTQNMIPSIIMTVHNPAKEQEQGLMISHGGTGSILEGLRVGVTLVVVPNTDLAGNHQEQLAIQLDKTGHAVHSSAEDIISAIEEAESRRHRVPGTHSWTGETEAQVSGAMADQLATLD